LTLVVVLPTPPFWFATQKIFAIFSFPRCGYKASYRSYNKTVSLVYMS
jgi:hypothetical protein